MKSEGALSEDGHWYCGKCWIAWRALNEANKEKPPPARLYDTSMEDGAHRYKRWLMPSAEGQEFDTDGIVALARQHGVLQGSVQYKELKYASGETHTIVFKDQGRNQNTSLGSVTICLSQGGTVNINGSPNKQERMLKKMQPWTTPWNAGTPPQGSTKSRRSEWHS